MADRDLLTKSDPFCVVYRVENGVKSELARTETIQDNLNPRWATKIKVDYFFERQQTLFFAMWVPLLIGIDLERDITLINLFSYDVDNPYASLDQQDFLGSATCDLADILASPCGYVNLKIG